MRREEAEVQKEGVRELTPEEQAEIVAGRGPEPPPHDDGGDGDDITG